MTRDQNIETLTASYAEYLRKLGSMDIARLVDDRELVVAPDLDINNKKNAEKLYTSSPADLGTDADNAYRDGVDNALELAQNVVDAVDRP